MNNSENSLHTYHADDFLRSMASNDLVNPRDLMGVHSIIERNGFITDRKKNPSAASTLSLLAQVHYSSMPLSIAEIIADRKGGIYPTRTKEEIQMLTDAQLLSKVRGPIEKYISTDVGSMELALNEIQNPSIVENRLRYALDTVLSKPPELAPEKYGHEEFRFTWESVHALMQKIFHDNAYAKANIAVLGSPLIGVFTSHCPDILNSVAVFDINSDMVDYIKTSNLNSNTVFSTVYDARMPFPPTLQNRYDAMVFDPPWHNEHYCLFADRAWQALRSLGKVYMSTFAPATRPEANKELTNLYKRFTDGGFHLSEISPEFFGYQIPEYERNVFRAQGINVTSRGNYGQLVVLEKQPERDDTVLTDELVDKLTQETHVELSKKEGTTLWIERGQTNIDNIRAPILVTEVNNHQVYTTTSRSERRAAGVNIITKDHIAYRCSNPYKLYLIDRLSNEGLSENDIIDRMVDEGYYIDKTTAGLEIKSTMQFIKLYF